MKSILSLTTGICFGFFLIGIGKGDYIAAAVAAAGIVSNVLIVIIHSEEFKS